MFFLGARGVLFEIIPIAHREHLRPTTACDCQRYIHFMRTCGFQGLIWPISWLESHLFLREFGCQSAIDAKHASVYSQPLGTLATLSLSCSGVPTVSHARLSYHTLSPYLMLLCPTPSSIPKQEDHHQDGASEAGSPSAPQDASPSRPRKKKRSSEETKLRKAPGAPKRFKSSYICFFMENQPAIKRELGEKASVSDVSKRSAEMWYVER